MVRIKNARLGVLYSFEIIPKQGNENIPDIYRFAYYNDTSIYLPMHTVGTKKLHPLLQTGGPDVPTATAPDGSVCIRLDWLKDKLPEYASIWAHLEMAIDRLRL